MRTEASGEQETTYTEPSMLACTQENLWDDESYETSIIAPILQMGKVKTSCPKSPS